MLKKFVLNMKLRGKAPGAILTLEVDKDGIPLDRYWRARLEEAKSNACMYPVTVSEIKKEVKKTTKADVVKEEKLAKESTKKKQENS